jgi:hypothetical protein
MMQYALVKDGVVENIVVAEDEEWLKAQRKTYDHVVELPEPVAVGHAYDGKTFTAPVEEETDDEAADG